MSTIHEKIKEMRLHRGFTLLQVAEHLGVKEATVQRYESGSIKNIKYDTIVKLSQLFKCTPQYLTGWEQSEKKNDIISDVILRLRSDDEFLKAVESMYKLSSEQLSAVLPILQALKQ